MNILILLKMMFNMMMMELKVLIMTYLPIDMMMFFNVNISFIY